MKYPPKPECSDDLMPTDLPDALEAWQHECDKITIEQLQEDIKRRGVEREYLENKIKRLKDEIARWKEKARSWRSVAERLEGEKQDQKGGE